MAKKTVNTVLLTWKKISKFSKHCTVVVVRFKIENTTNPDSKINSSKHGADIRGCERQSIRLQKTFKMVHWTPEKGKATKK